MIPNNITRENIISAAREIGNEVPRSRESTSYLAEVEGKHFPPKYLISIANKYANSDELNSEEFNAGEARNFLERLGFKTINKKTEKRNVWIEKTAVHSKDRTDRLTGDYALGKALWSPTASKSGVDIYKNMKKIKEGDLVLHLIDNSYIAGISIVQEPAIEIAINLGTPWDGQCYYVKLCNYLEFKNQINRTDILNTENYAKLKEIALKSEVFYQSNYELRQGAYLTPCIEELQILLNSIYKSKYNDNIPYLEVLLPGANNEDEEEEIFIETEWIENINNLPSNSILYGPPGTGKTYKVVDKALEIINKEKFAGIINDSQKRLQAIEAFQELLENGRIEFCTFHQSFSYEEFVEGLRSNGQGGFEPKNGVFKRICDAAQTINLTRESTYDFDEKTINFHKMSLGRYMDPEEDDIYDHCIGNNVIALGWGEDVDFTGCKTKEEIADKYRAKYPSGQSFNIDAINRFMITMKTGDLVLISQGNSYIRAIARVTGEYSFNDKTDIRYNHFRQVQWLYKDVKIPIQQLLKNKMLSQQTIYEFWTKDINIENLREYLSGKVDKAENNNFVLIIDEINRGNISKIFGELITLIEPDKRIGGANEITVTLPYSGDKFGVPSNLYILGTMNTADRSIALLDTALRRRFDFEELMPDYNLLPEDVDGVNVRRMLMTINQRIEYLFDRDHTIGHAYFLKSHLNTQELLNIMKWNVIPLLQEYFYDDWEKIALVLGDCGIEGETNYFINKSHISATQLFGKQYKLDEVTKDKYTLASNPDKQALLNIYSVIYDAEI